MVHEDGDHVPRQAQRAPDHGSPHQELPGAGQPVAAAAAAAAATAAAAAAAAPAGAHPGAAAAAAAAVAEGRPPFVLFRAGGRDGLPRLLLLLLLRGGWRRQRQGHGWKLRRGAEGILAQSHQAPYYGDLFFVPN